MLRGRMVVKAGSVVFFCPDLSCPIFPIPLYSAHPSKEGAQEGKKEGTNARVLRLFWLRRVCTLTRTLKRGVLLFYAYPRP